MNLLEGEIVSGSIRNEIIQLQPENSNASQQDFSAEELQH